MAEAAQPFPNLPEVDEADLHEVVAEALAVAIEEGKTGEESYMGTAPYVALLDAAAKGSAAPAEVLGFARLIAANLGYNLTPTEAGAE